MSPPEIPGQPLSKNILQVFLISCLDFSFSLLGKKETQNNVWKYGFKAVVRGQTVLPVKEAIYN